MRKITENLYVGTVEDYEQHKEDKDFCFLSCCKEPIHRKIVGYTGRGCPKDNKEYLFAYRDNLNLLALNMVDANNAKFFSDEMIEEALDFIDLNKHTNKVLVFCNQSISRSPSIVFLYLVSKGEYKCKPYEQAKTQFKWLYPDFNPSQGIDDYMRNNWVKFNGDDV